VITPDNRVVGHGRAPDIYGRAGQVQGLPWPLGHRRAGGPAGAARARRSRGPALTDLQQRVLRIEDDVIMGISRTLVEGT